MRESRQNHWLILKNKSLEIQMHGSEIEIEYMLDEFGNLWRGPKEHDGTQMPWAIFQGFRHSDGGPIWCRKSSSKPFPFRIVKDQDGLVAEFVRLMEDQRASGIECVVKAAARGEGVTA